MSGPFVVCEKHHCHHHESVACPVCVNEKEKDIEEQYEEKSYADPE
jgi:hypothetical protein